MQVSFVNEAQEEHVFPDFQQQMAYPYTYTSTVQCSSNFDTITLRFSTQVTVPTGYLMDLHQHLIQTDSSFVDTDHHKSMMNSD
jgi:hypothetical protein